MKNAVFWDVTPYGSFKNRGSEERSASIITMTKIGELRTTLTVTFNNHTDDEGATFLRNVGSYKSHTA
jgi:hypothetical protein